MMRACCPPTHARAFSLIEAIIAIVILSVAVPAMFWAIRDATERRAEPVMLARARWLAAERLEDAIADRHSATRGYAYVQTSNYPAEAGIAGFAGFSRQVAIADRGPDLVTAGAGYKVITVTVSYPGLRGTTRTFDLAGVVTDY